MDIELLSHTQYFVGMSRSTYSMLIASMVAAKHDIIHSRMRRYEEIHRLQPDRNHSSIGHVEHAFLWSVDETCIERHDPQRQHDVLDYCHDWVDLQPPLVREANSCKKHPSVFMEERRECAFVESQ